MNKRVREKERERERGREGEEERKRERESERGDGELFQRNKLQDRIIGRAAGTIMIGDICKTGHCLIVISDEEGQRLTAEMMTGLGNQAIYLNRVA